MKRATSAAFRGHGQYFNSATPILIEYLERKRLAELGYTSSLKEESDFTRECFLIIDREICRLEEDKRRREALIAGQK